MKSLSETVGSGVLNANSYDMSHISFVSKSIEYEFIEIICSWTEYFPRVRLSQTDSDGLNPILLLKDIEIDDSAALRKPSVLIELGVLV